jgi:hypothetical protein
VSRNLCITAVDGQTAYLIAELVATNPQFSNKVDSITGLSLDPHSSKYQALKKLGVDIAHHVPGGEKQLIEVLKKSDADTICVIPPTHVDKYQITLELI